MKNSYAAALDRLLQKRSGIPTLGHDEATHQLVLANLYNLFPSDTWQVMLEKAHLNAYNQCLAILDLRHVSELINGISAKAVGDHGLTRSPAIYVASHCGPYRIIAPYIMSAGIPLTVVVDNTVATQQGSIFADHFMEFAKEEGLPSNFMKVRDTSEPGLILGILKDLKQGRSVLFYFDGNKGATGTSGKENLKAVDFLGHRLNSRVGIPQIAAIAKKPIVPINAFRGEIPWEVTIQVCEPIEAGSTDREIFALSTMQTLWLDLGKRIAFQPEQWEAIRYVHLFIDYTKSVSAVETYFDCNKRAFFNYKRFFLKIHGDRGEMFDRSRFSVIGLTGAALQCVGKAYHHSGDFGIGNGQFSDGELSWMHQRNFII